LPVPPTNRSRSGGRRRAQALHVRISCLCRTHRAWRLNRFSKRAATAVSWRPRPGLRPCRCASEVSPPRVIGKSATPRGTLFSRTRKGPRSDRPLQEWTGTGTGPGPLRRRRRSH